MLTVWLRFWSGLMDKTKTGCIPTLVWSNDYKVLGKRRGRDSSSDPQRRQSGQQLHHYSITLTLTLKQDYTQTGLHSMSALWRPADG